MYSTEPSKAVFAPLVNAQLLIGLKFFHAQYHWNLSLSALPTPGYLSKYF